MCGMRLTLFKISILMGCPTAAVSSIVCAAQLHTLGQTAGAFVTRLPRPDAV